MSYNVRGRAMRSIAPAIGSIETPGLLPRIIVYVKTGSRDMRDRWAEFIRDWGVSAQEVQRCGEGNGQHPFWTAFDVCGSPQALEELAFWKPVFVLDAHLAINAAIPSGRTSVTRTHDHCPMPEKHRKPLIRVDSVATVRKDKETGERLPGKDRIRDRVRADVSATNAAPTKRVQFRNGRVNGNAAPV